MRKDRRSSCSLGDSESGYQAPPCYKLQTFPFFNFPTPRPTNLSRWPCPRSDRTTRLLLATNFKLFLSSTSQLQDQPTCQDGRVQDQTELPGSSLLQTSNFSFLQLPNSKTNQPVKMAMSKIRQNYHEDCEALINKQINMEFYASYVYLSMSSFFNRDDQALHGFADHFKKESNEERAHAMKFM